MYARTVNGKVLSFGVSGKLVRNSLIMYDRQTHSLWSHLTGTAIRGPLKGAELEVLTATETTWGTWRRAYPNTLILPHDYPGQADPYRRYFSGPEAGVIGRKREDNRLPTKAKVVGIRITDMPKAYALDAVVKAKVVNDTFDALPIVLFRTADGSASVFRRDLNGQTLTFQAGSTGTFTDKDTSSTWDPLTGKAVSGSLSGSSLTPIPSTTSFWFGWYDFFPGTALWP